MDLGIKYTTTFENVTIDLAYYISSEGSWRGSSRDSARYSYDVVRWNLAVNPDGTVDFDAPTNGFRESHQLNARAWIPSVSLSYFHETANIPWLDSVTPYVEYSSIMKRAAGFNDSALFILGAAWARGGWYIYTDFAYSNGNYFVGDDGR